MDEGGDAPTNRKRVPCPPEMVRERPHSEYIIQTCGTFSTRLAEVVKLFARSLHPNSTTWGLGAKAYRRRWVMLPSRSVLRLGEELIIRYFCASGMLGNFRKRNTIYSHPLTSSRRIEPSSTRRGQRGREDQMMVHSSQPRVSDCPRASSRTTERWDHCAEQLSFRTQHPVPST